MVKDTPSKTRKAVAQKAEVIRKSMSGLGQGLSDGAGRVADIILDNDEKAKGQKTQKITDETLQVFKGVSQRLKTDLKGVKGSDFVAVMAYSAGKGAASVKRGAKWLME